MTTLPGQGQLFDDDDEREPDDAPEELCRACGGRTRFKGRRNRTEIYECSEPSCGLLFEVMIPSKPISAERCHLCHGPGTEGPGTGPHFKRFDCSDKRCGGWRWLSKPRTVEGGGHG
jgi:hypothetical protein